MSAITVPAKVGAAVKPPPSKAEVIEAMAQLKYQQLCKEHKERREAQEMAREACEEALIRYVEKNFAKVQISGELGYVNVTTKEVYHVQVTCRIDVSKAPELHKKLLAFHTMPCAGMHPDLDKIRKQVREGIRQKGIGSKDDRIQAILNVPAARKALENALQELDKPAVPQIANS